MKINTSKLDKIKETLAAVETGCSARKFDPDTIKMAIKAGERQLSQMSIPKKSWAECRIVCDPEKVANGYQGTPEGTSVTLTRGSSSWFVTAIQRMPSGRCSYGGDASAKLELSATAVLSIPTSYQMEI